MGNLLIRQNCLNYTNNSLLNIALVIYISLLFHEIGHFILAFLFRFKVQKFSIGIFGLNLEINLRDASINKKIALFYAGPFFNFLLAGMFYYFDILLYVNVNIFLGLINLIPIVPLDGGNVLKVIISAFIKKEKVFYVIIIINLFFLILLIVAFFGSYNIVYIALSYISIKGIIIEKNFLFEEKIINSYKKHL